MFKSKKKLLKLFGFMFRNIIKVILKVQYINVLANLRKNLGKFRVLSKENINFKQKLIINVYKCG